VPSHLDSTGALQIVVEGLIYYNTRSPKSVFSWFLDISMTLHYLFRLIDQACGRCLHKEME
jgi:hypothetical protein